MITILTYIDLSKLIEYFSINWVDGAFKIGVFLLFLVIIYITAKIVTKAVIGEIKGYKKSVVKNILKEFEEKTKNKEDTHG